jgi:hypothetical protein
MALGDWEFRLRRINFATAVSVSVIRFASRACLPLPLSGAAAMPSACVTGVARASEALGAQASCKLVGDKF